MYTCRELLRHEWNKLLTVPPFKELGTAPDPNHARVAGVFDEEDNLKGYWYIFDAVHVEPLWLSDDCKKNPKVAKELLTNVKSILSESTAPIAFAIIKIDDFPTHVPMAARLGFKAVPGSLFYIAPDNKALDELITRRKG